MPAVVDGVVWMNWRKGGSIEMRLTGVPERAMAWFTTIMRRKEDKRTREAKVTGTKSLIEDDMTEIETIVETIGITILRGIGATGGTGHGIDHEAEAREDATETDNSKLVGAE